MKNVHLPWGGSAASSHFLGIFPTQTEPDITLEG